MAINRQLFTKYFANSFLGSFNLLRLVNRPSGGLLLHYFGKFALMEMILWLMGSFHGFGGKVNLTR